jgi:hypothetical protein
LVLFHPKSGAQRARLVGLHDVKSIEEMINGHAEALTAKKDGGTRPTDQAEQSSAAAGLAGCRHRRSRR